MTLHLLAAAGVLVLLTLTPGPDMAVVTRHAITGGRGAGLRAALGVVVGLLVWGALAAAGLTALLAASPEAYLALKVVGVAYLLWLALQSFRGDGHVDGDVPTSPRPFATGLTTNLLNPKIAVFYAALLPTLAPPGLGAWGLVALVAVHAAVTVAWLGAYAWLIDRARARFERPGVRRAVERATGVALVGFAVRLATSAR